MSRLLGVAKLIASECIITMTACHIMWPTWHPVPLQAAAAGIFSCGVCSEGDVHVPVLSRIAQ